MTRPRLDGGAGFHSTFGSRRSGGRRHAIAARPSGKPAGSTLPPPARVRKGRVLEAIAAGIVLAYCGLVASGVEQQWPPDFAAFYSSAHALTVGGFQVIHLLYSIPLQRAAEAGFSSGAGRVYFEPFMNPWPAALLVAPFTVLPLRAAFLAWDLICLVLCAAGTYWLSRSTGLKYDATLLTLAAMASYPVYLALGLGQYDLLWPACLALFTSALGASDLARRSVRTTLAVIVFSLKPDLLVAMVVPGVRTWRHRVVREAWLIVVGVALVVALPMGLGGVALALHLETFALFHKFPPLADVTVLGFLWHVLGAGHVTEVLAEGTSAALLLAFAWLWWHDPPQTKGDWYLSLTSAICLSLAIAPHALSHDLVLLVGPMVWIARVLRDSGRSLSWMWAWYGLFNVAVILDGTPLLNIPISLTFVALLLAASAAWVSRSRLQGTPAPYGTSTKPAPTPAPAG